jgi:hypothetical protein
MAYFIRIFMLSSSIHALPCIVLEDMKNSVVRTACYTFKKFCFSSCKIIVECIDDGGSTFSRHISTCLHGVISQNTGIITRTAMRTSDLASKTNLEENYKNFD